MTEHLRHASSNCSYSTILNRNCLPADDWLILSIRQCSMDCCSAFPSCRILPVSSLERSQPPVETKIPVKVETSQWSIVYNEIRYSNTSCSKPRKIKFSSIFPELYRLIIMHIFTLPVNWLSKTTPKTKTASSKYLRALRPCSDDSIAR